MKLHRLLNPLQITIENHCCYLLKLLYLHCTAVSEDSDSNYQESVCVSVWVCVCVCEGERKRDHRVYLSRGPLYRIRFLPQLQWCQPCGWKCGVCVSVKDPTCVYYRCVCLCVCVSLSFPLWYTVAAQCRLQQIMLLCSYSLLVICIKWSSWEPESADVDLWMLDNG